MATSEVSISEGRGFRVKYVDMGDGTSVPAVAVVADSSGGGGGSGLTDAQLRATPVPVSGTVAVTGVSTAALQTALNTAIGPATARAAVTDPAAAADANQLLRGILAALNQIVINTTTLP